MRCQGTTHCCRQTALCRCAELQSPATHTAASATKGFILALLNLLQGSGRTYKMDLFLPIGCNSIPMPSTKQATLSNKAGIPSVSCSQGRNTFSHMVEKQASASPDSSSASLRRSAGDEAREVNEPALSPRATDDPCDINRLAPRVVMPSLSENVLVFTNSLLSKTITTQVPTSAVAAQSLMASRLLVPCMKTTKARIKMHTQCCNRTGMSILWVSDRIK